jgi:hypothetical protein
MKKIALAAALAVAATSAFAGNPARVVMEAPVVVAEEAGSSLGSNLIMPAILLLLIAAAVGNK